MPEGRSFLFLHQKLQRSLMMQLKVKNSSFYYVFSIRKSRRKLFLCLFHYTSESVSYVSNLHLVYLHSF